MAPYPSPLMRFGVCLTAIFLSLSAFASNLFDDLSLVEEINRKQNDELPFLYNSTLMGGYFTMPSARMPPVGTIALGGGRITPYNNYALSFQFFDRLELSANYRVFTGMPETTFGHEGFGDDAERIGNVKFVFNRPEDGFPDLPTFAIGVEDFLGTKRFNSEYIVMTKCWTVANVEATVGWGRKRIKGFFGGLAWTPLRQVDIPFFKDLTLAAEYDAIDYKHHAPEHPEGRKIKSRVNLGVSWLAWNTMQVSVSSLRGGELAAFGSLRYPLGTTKGFFTKAKDPLSYRSPIDTQPLGVTRPKKEFAQELGFALGLQGFVVYRVYLTADNTLWIKIINNTYREEVVVRERLQRVLSALTPSDISSVIVVDEADGVPCQAYKFRGEDLARFRQGAIGEFELETIAPMREAILRPKPADLLFKRSKEIWTFTMKPRILNFFGSSSGKIKYNFGLIASPEGYLFDEIYYEGQLSYSIKSSMSDVSDVDRLNPSQLPNVRTDTIRYFQTNSISVEMAYLQKSWNLGKGFFYRLATGYFESAYGGAATEFLFYPVNWNWAIGIEEATVWKRHYHGFNFHRKIRKLDGFRPHYIPFLGVQYFLDIFYTYRPLDMDFKVMIGQFLAKDKGAKFEVSRWFKSGINVALWVTVTNGDDKVNGKIYFDKGFAFMVPLDFFLRQSSRSYMGYARSAWLRDVGAVAATGRGLYNTIRLERL